MVSVVGVFSKVWGRDCNPHNNQKYLQKQVGASITYNLSLAVSQLQALHSGKTMVSNRISSYKETRYCPLSCGTMEEGRNAEKEVSGQLSRPASQRKDTKDSGYGDLSCECEEVCFLRRN